MTSELRELLVIDLAHFMQDLGTNEARTFAHELTMAVSAFVTQGKYCAAWPQVRAFPRKTWNELTVGVPWEAFSQAHGVLKSAKTKAKSRAVCSAPSCLDSNLNRYVQSSQMWGGSLLTAIGRVMKEVERELILFAPYWRTEGVDMLISAAGRLDYTGIRVLVVTQPQHHMREEDQRGLLHFMKSMSAAKAIVEVIAPKPNNSGTPFAHAKLLIADGEAAYVGSANFTSSGMHYGLEAGVIVSGALARDFVQWIDNLRHICEPWESSR